MTSAINPNNIDGQYPIAGQDNNSQGFRDNFTNTKTNFQYAADEITDLQNKVVLKQALDGSTLNNDMLGSVLSNAQLQDMSYTRVALGTLGGTVNINYASGSYQTVTTNGSITLAFTNFPAAGLFGSVTVQVTVMSTAHTLTFPSAASVNASGIVGYFNNVINFPATGVYTFTFSTSDGGSTITVNEQNQQLTPFDATFDLVTNAGACSLATTTSKFDPATATWTATLAAGVAGQTKMLMQLSAGTINVTVANAGWQTSGTGVLTLNAIGEGCILRYSSGKWRCVGNNGATFA